jgi:hypothetical protein
VKLHSRLSTAVNVDPVMATLAPDVPWASKPSRRQSDTNRAQTLRIAVFLKVSPIQSSEWYQPWGGHRHQDLAESAPKTATPPPKAGVTL